MKTCKIICLVRTFRSVDTDMVAAILAEKVCGSVYGVCVCVCVCVCGARRTHVYSTHMHFSPHTCLMSMCVCTLYMQS